MELRLNIPKQNIYGRNVTTESVRELFFQQIKQLTLKTAHASS